MAAGREFFDVVLSQRACRHFSDRPVDDDLVARCLVAATHAPSAENLQPWVFVVVRELRTRAAVGDLMRELWRGRRAPTLRGAPVPGPPRRRRARCRGRRRRRTGPRGGVRGRVHRTRGDPGLVGLPGRAEPPPGGERPRAGLGHDHVGDPGRGPALGAAGPAALRPADGRHPARLAGPAPRPPAGCRWRHAPISTPTANPSRTGDRLGRPGADRPERLPATWPGGHPAEQGDAADDVPGRRRAGHAPLRPAGEGVDGAQLAPRPVPGVRVRGQVVRRGEAVRRAADDSATGRPGASRVPGRLRGLRLHPVDRGQPLGVLRSPIPDDLSGLEPEGGG